MLYRYREASPTPAEKYLSELTADIVSHRLFIDVPKITFFEESPLGDIAHSVPILGLCDSIRIFLKLGMEPRELVRICAHEVRHLKGYFDRNVSREGKERESVLYAHEFLTNLRGRTHDDLICELILMKYANLPPKTKALLPAQKTLRGSTYETTERFSGSRRSASDV